MTIKSQVYKILPWWLRGTVAGTFLKGVAELLDNGIETARLAIKAGNPLTCEEDALPWIAIDRRIRRYPTEPIQSHRLRLAQFRQLWRHAGSAYGQMLALQSYFLPGAVPRIRIVHQCGDGSNATWHTLDPDGTYSVHRATPSNWDWDGVPAKWSRYWVIIYTDGLSPLVETITYDDGYGYDEGWIYDGLFTHAQIDDMVSIVNDFEPPHAVLWGLILATDPASFDPAGSGAGYPGGDWGYDIDMTTGLATRLESAVYSYDLGQG